MRRALIDDFASVPGVEVVTTLDARLSVKAPPGVVVRLVFDRGENSFADLASEADFVLAVAPETGGILLRLAKLLEEIGVVSLGSNPFAVALTGHKMMTYKHFSTRNISTPPTRLIDTRAGAPSLEWDGPSVVKPVDGAGSVDTFRWKPGDPWPPEVRDRGSMIIQPYLEGMPMSASFLVDHQGVATPLAHGIQKITLDANRIRYEGGSLLAYRIDLTEISRALDIIPGLRGFVGVDFLWSENAFSLLEINPRPTTSVVGLTRLWPPGTIAGAWLEGATRGLEGTEWPERLRASRVWEPVSFNADGSINTQEDDR